MATLVITQDCISVRSEGERLELVRSSADPEQAPVRLQVPLFDVDRVTVVGRPMITMAVFHKLLSADIPVTFISSRGKWLGALSAGDALNAGRRILQYESFRNLPWRQKVAARIIYAKIRNSRRTLQRLAVVRKCLDVPEQQKAMHTLARVAKIVRLRGGALETLRGWEGMAAACYFERLNRFFPPELPFGERLRQPPGNAANALLSWSYAIVQGEIDSVLRGHGLDVCIGALHTVSNGMPSLALDILEVFRAPICDMLTLHLLNHHILTAVDFEVRNDDGGTYLKADSRKKFFQTYEQVMTRKFTPPDGNSHIDFRQAIERDVCSYLKYLEQGDADGDFFLMP